MQDRTKFLGGTDAAAVLGLSRFRTPLEVWAIKTGTVKEEDISNKLSVKLGKKLEDTVAELFEEETGKKTHKVSESQIHPEYPFLGAQIDRKVEGEDAVLEVKTASAWKAKEWVGEEIPIEYIIQVMHQLAVTGRKLGYIAVLIGNQDFKWKKIVRDEKMIKEMVKKEVDFWNNFVLTKTMPMIVKAQDDDILYKLYPDSNQKEVELGDDANKVLESLEGLRADRASVEDAIAQQENELKLMLKENEIGITDKYRFSWKTQQRQSVDLEKLKGAGLYEQFAKITQTRVFRYGKKKEE